MMKPSGIQVNKPVVAVLAVVAIALVWYLTSRSSTKTPSFKEVMDKTAAQGGHDSSGDAVKDGQGDVGKDVQGVAGKDVQGEAGKDGQGEAGKDGQADAGESVNLKDLPTVDISKITVNPTKLKVKAGQTEVEVLGLEVVPSEKSKVDVLLLHGAKFAPKDWEQIKTLQLFGALGYRMFAIKLPETYVAEPKDRLEFMTNLIATAKLAEPVIISPSASGSYSIQMLVKLPEGSLRGFVALAPVATETFTAEEYKGVKVPTLIVYGDLDKALGSPSYENLKNIPNSKSFTVKDGQHAFYMNTPDIFHKYLYNFLVNLSA